MRIAVITRFLRPPLEGVGQHTYAILDLLIHNHPEVEWHLINDGQAGQVSWENKNVIQHSLGPATRHPILWHIWYEWRLPKLLKKINPQSVWYPDGFMSIQSEVPSLLTIHDLAYLKYPDGSIRSHRKYLEKKMPLQVRRASKIACVSRFIKNEVIETFNVGPDKIVITSNAPHSNFKPLTADQVSAFRNEHTRSLPYFLYLGSVHPRKNIHNLIRAFGLFKQDKDQPHLLVLAGRWAWKSEKIKKTLEASPVRNQILLKDDLDTIRYELVGAASAMIYISLYEGFGMPVVEALSCSTPVITSPDSAMEEVAGDTAIYVNPINPEEIASSLRTLVRDSDKTVGIKRAKSFTWNNSAHTIWSILSEQDL